MRPPEFEIDPTTPPRVRLDILYEELILPGSRDPAMIELSHSINREGVRAGRAGRVDPVGQLQLLLDWQYDHIAYVEDPPDAKGWQREIFKWAWKAIRDKGDDCEGKITVFSTLAEAAGYRAIPVWIEQPSSRNNHVAGNVAVPLWAAMLLPPVNEYDVVVVRPTHVPAITGVWGWVEGTLPRVRTHAGIVPAAQIGEFPYDEQNRQRAAGLTRVRI